MGRTHAPTQRLPQDAPPESDEENKTLRHDLWPLLLASHPWTLSEHTVLHHIVHDCGRSSMVHSAIFFPYHKRACDARIRSRFELTIRRCYCTDALLALPVRSRTELVKTSNLPHCTAEPPCGRRRYRLHATSHRIIIEDCVSTSFPFICAHLRWVA